MTKLTFLFLSVAFSLLFAGYSSVAVVQTADDNFQNTLAQLRQSKQDFKDAKAKEVSEAAEEGKAKTSALRQAAQQRRQEAKQKREEKRKETLLKLVDIQIKWLNRTKERVQKMPNISQELKTQLSSEVDAAVQKLNELKTKIQAASGQDAIKGLAKEVRDFFKLKREVVKKIVEAIHASRVNSAMAKAQDRLAAIKVKIQELKTVGKDTVELEKELSEAEENIAEAQESAGRKAFREANEDLKGAYQKFRNIAQKAKGL